MDGTSSKPTRGDQDDRRAYWEARLRADYNFAGVGYTELGEAFNRRIYRVRRHGMHEHPSYPWPTHGRIGPRCWVGDRIHDRSVARGWVRKRLRDATYSVAVDRLTRRFPSHRFLNVDISSAQIPLERIRCRDLE